MNSTAAGGTGVVSVYRNECEEQPQRLRELFDAYRSDAGVRKQLATVKTVVSRSLPVLWLGMGASYCSALVGASQLMRLGRSSFAREASEWLHYETSTRNQVSGPILVSTSGESAEMVRICRILDGRGRILLCNSRGSTCWSASRIRLPILAGQEWANATKTYTNSAAAAVILSSELAGGCWQAESDLVVDAFGKSLIHAFEQRHALEEFCRGATNIEIIGRGPALAGALMGALCVREMTGLRVFAHSSGGFRHGPLLDVSPGHVAIILALGPTANLGTRLAGDCHSRGGKVVLVTADSDASRSERILPIRVQPAPEPWEGLTSVIVPQALTLALAERIGSHYVRVQTTNE